MPDLLLPVLIAVIVAVAGAIIAFLVRRHRAAGAAAAVAARPALPDPAERDNSWRILVSGASRPEAQPQETDPVTGAAAPLRVAHEDAGPAASPALVPVPPATVVSGGQHALQPAVPDESSRRRLWRDTATVLLVSCLAILAVTTLVPGGAAAPEVDGVEEEIGAPSTGEEPDATEATNASAEPPSTLVPVVAPPLPTVEPSARPGALATPKPTPPLTPRTTPAPVRPTAPPATPRPTAPPTAAPTPTPTPVATPSPTPTPDPTPEPTPEPTTPPVTPPPDSPPG